MRSTCVTWQFVFSLCQTLFITQHFRCSLFYLVYSEFDILNHQMFDIQSRIQLYHGQIQSGGQFAESDHVYVKSNLIYSNVDLALITFSYVFKWCLFTINTFFEIGQHFKLINWICNICFLCYKIEELSR